MIDETALILSIRPLAQGYQVLTLAAPAIAAEAKPGQFVHVRVPSLDAALADKPQAELYACGPDGMLRAVGERAIAAGIKGWLSLDKHMVCGVGACLACVQKIRREDGADVLARVCVDGPVFESREIVW